ncbi:MAG: LON peptidase substrate-binding domain-containing protein [Pseudomonadota bacterium]
MAPRSYHAPEDLPASVPVFPLGGVLLLPRGELPLNIFEPRYLDMIDAALGGDRLIGMVQPKIGDQPSATTEDDDEPSGDDTPELMRVGGLGRISAFQETNDGRYLITLTGLCRFRVLEELDTTTLFRQCRVSASEFGVDFKAHAGEDQVDRDKLLETFRAYLDANDLKADWSSVTRAPTEALVNGLAMMSPFGAREKQALLEAKDLNERADILVAMTEMSLLRADEDDSSTLQ